MGLVFAEIELTNAEDIGVARRGLMPESHVRSMQVTALVDSGAYMMGINETIRTQLGLRTTRTASAQLADSQVVQLDVAGPLGIKFANRSTIVEAIVLPGDSTPLLGAIPIEYMDVLIDPKNHRLVVNPEHPYIAGTSLR